MLFIFCVCSFRFISYLHDQKEYDNYFVISREANMLATLNKIEILYSLVNHCGKNKHRYPINKIEIKKDSEESNSVTIIPYNATRG